MRNFHQHMFTMDDPIELVNDVDKKYLTKLENLGIKTVGDFIYHLPHRYDDFSEFKKINQVADGEMMTVQGLITEIKTTQAWKKRMTITEAHIQDTTGTIKAIWFNTPAPLKYLTNGKAVRISGKISTDKKNILFFSHPNFELIPTSALQKEQSEATLQPDNTSTYSTGILAPIYHETTGLKSFWFRRAMKDLLSHVEVVDFIPQDILDSQNLIGLATALQHIHFPRSKKEVVLAKKRFAFEKIFLIQLKSLLTKNSWNKKTAAKIPFNKKYIKTFVKNLPFTLTTAQKKCTWQIIQDLGENRPMNRLLEGDVGTGKTVISAIAALSVVSQLYQVAILAPTEILAIQHYKSLRKLFSTLDFTIAILTRSEVKAVAANQVSKKITRPKLLEKLANGEIDLIIGTHAIIQKDVIFKNIGLAIIDEQHRFGVRQRAFLQQESVNNSKIGEVTPHLLSMTATPIPRTLSLAMFSNLDLSIVDEFPVGHKKIITKIVNPKGRTQVYTFVKQSVKKGRQVFVIFPLVTETSKILEVKAATEEHQRLQADIFPNFTLGLLHGKMKPAEKNNVMQDFKNKKIDILIATSVVEVGVDVPNASIMIIEGAERFGLAQLHQFRGRVGRGGHQSHCFLFTSDNVADSTSRLNILEKTNDGFKISAADLKLRGPGQFMGTAQSGVPDIAMESLSDIKTIEQAKLEAQRVISFDPDFKKLPLIKKEVEKLETVAHWE